MSISLLYNSAAVAAGNQLNITSANLQKTLFRLASGSRINTGADDAAGLAIRDGLNANVSALNQSAQNANNAVGELQVSDGALAQVTNLLNRAVTLATESATGTVSDAQRTDINAEFTAIKSEIDRIGSNTTYNGTRIFQAANGADPNSYTFTPGTPLTSTTALTTGATFTIGDGANTHTFTAGATSKVSDLINDINSQSTVSAKAYLDGGGNLILTDPLKKGDLTAATTDAVLGTKSQPTVSQASSINIFLSDSTTAGSSTISVALGALSSTQLNFGSSNISLGADSLATAGGAQTALTDINQAIQNVAALRGGIGAGINRLQTASQVISSQQQNLAAASDTISAADISQEVAHLTQYNILTSTGISALAQANQSQQAILKLLQ
ncbi:MAG: flagellin [Acidobacteriaceae bacterium]